MPRPLRNIAIVSLSTVGSRCLGLLRDILIFAALGTSLWNSAFILAFTLPNLFRRLFGEGALTSAIVPIFSDRMESGGRASAYSFLNQVLFRLFWILVLLVGVGIGTLKLALCTGWLPENWAASAQLALRLLPYMLFICLAAIISAGLNVLGRFAVTASMPILLNLSMISTLSLGLYLKVDGAQLVFWLCGGVLFGGLLQLLFPMLELIRQGWKPKIESKGSEAISELRQLFLPGVIGAGILQINILISRLLAYSLEASTLSVFYLAGRLIELPLGVFTIAITTVFFPLLARTLARSDTDEFRAAFLRGMRLILSISIPAGIGLIALGEPILDTLFVWGAFESSDVKTTIPILAIYGLGLPFYSVATFATRSLHAGKDMRTPVRIAGICVIINLFTGLVLMQLQGARGLAAANVITSGIQSVLLWRALVRLHPKLCFKSLGPSILKILSAAIVMGLICVYARPWIASFELNEKLSASLTVAILLPAGIAIYFGLLFLSGFKEFDELKQQALKWHKQKKTHSDRRK